MPLVDVNPTAGAQAQGPEQAHHPDYYQPLLPHTLLQTRP